ncbi:MAG: preprotein translocase subunit SecG [Eubacteriales bacterium]|nr:preprotein translocase subunit SecG [Eubacteriales bacterium]
MVTALMVILAIISVLLIFVILLQPSQSDGLSSSIAGGAEQLFGRKKARGYEAVLKKVTVFLTVLFLVLSIVALVLSK